MCGRFVGYRSKEELLDLFPIDSCETEVVANYNIAPTQSYDHYRTGQPPGVKAGQCGSQQQFVQHQTHEADGVEVTSGGGNTDGYIGEIKYIIMITAKRGSAREPVPAGTYPARCYKIVHFRVFLLIH